MVFGLPPQVSTLCSFILLQSIVRRVWSSKTKVADTASEMESESPVKTPSSRNGHSRKRIPKQRRASFPEDSDSPSSRTPKRSSSYPDSLPKRRQTPKRSIGFTNDFSPIELRSPLKEAHKTAAKTSGRKRSRSTPGKEVATPNKQRKASVKKTKPKAREENVWSVSEILDHKMEQGKHYFLVRWEGTNEKGKPWDDTWEPKQNISQDLIADFWDNLRKAKQSKKASSGKARK